MHGGEEVAAEMPFIRLIFGRRTTSWHWYAGGGGCVRANVRNTHGLETGSARTSVRRSVGKGKRKTASSKHGVVSPVEHCRKGQIDQDVGERHFKKVAETRT